MMRATTQQRGGDEARSSRHRHGLMKLKNLYLGYYFSANAIFYIPILLLHFQATSLTPGRSLYLVTIFAFVIAISEIPLGIVADTLGLRASLLASLAFGGVGAVLFATTSSFWTFALGQSSVALSMSLSSGTAAAYLYELCHEQGLEYQALEGLATSTRYLALGGAGLLGGSLFLHHPSLPFWLTLALTLTSAVFLLALPRERRRSHPASKPSLGQVLEVSRKLFDVKSALMVLLIYSSLFLAVTGTMYWSYQPFLHGLGISSEWFGGLYFLFFLSASAGSRVAGPANRRIGYHRSVPALSLLLGLLIVAAALTRSVWAVILAVGIQFLHGYADPTLRIVLQSRIEPAARATFLSARSTLHRLFLAAISASLGHGIDRVGMSITFLVLGTSVVAGSLVLGGWVSSRVEGKGEGEAE